MIVYHTIPNTYKTEDWIKVDGWDIGASNIEGSEDTVK
jgi:hypothetical protein